jgi:ABC-type proline/glycine betaine transport system substrate-binding protein
MPDTPGLMFWGNVIGSEPGWTAERIEQQMIEDRDIRDQS